MNPKLADTPKTGAFRQFLSAMRYREGQRLRLRPTEHPYRISYVTNGGYSGFRFHADRPDAHFSLLRGVLREHGDDVSQYSFSQWVGTRWITTHVNGMPVAGVRQ